jgi:DNA-binding CsgD family transcriptional regulator
MDSQLSPKRIKSSLRRAEALRLRKEGKTFREIAQVMGISLTRARQLVADGFNRLLGSERELAAQLLKQQLDRLDTLAETFWLPATEGHRESAEVLLKVIDRQIRLLGQEAAKKVDATVRSGEVDLSTMSESEIKEHCRRLGIPVRD